MERETGPDSSEEMQRPRGEVGSGREGDDGATDNRVASQGGENRGSVGKYWTAPDREADRQQGGTGRQSGNARSSEKGAEMKRSVVNEDRYSSTESQDCSGPGCEGTGGTTEKRNRGRMCR